MSYTDLRDFEPEASYRLTGNDGERYVVQVEKLGGGTKGYAYTGKWRYIVVKPALTNEQTATVVRKGQDFDSPKRLTHRRAAQLILELILNAERED